MKKMTLLNVIIVLVLCVIVVGFYQEWFVLASHSDGDSNKVEVNLTVDPDKAKDDVKAVEAKARELTGTEAEDTPPSPSENDVKQNDE